MFGSREKYELESEIRCLKNEVKEKTKSINCLYDQISDLKDQLQGVNEQNAKQVFDFLNPSIEVFTIERTQKLIDHKMRWCTNIGYFIIDKSEDDKVHEWYMFTTIDQHNELVKEFEKSLENRK